jgi:hypothetical protein
MLFFRTNRGRVIRCFPLFQRLRRPTLCTHHMVATIPLRSSLLHTFLISRTTRTPRPTLNSFHSGLILMCLDRLIRMSDTPHPTLAKRIIPVSLLLNLHHLSELQPLRHAKNIRMVPILPKLVVPSAGLLVSANACEPRTSIAVFRTNSYFGSHVVSTMFRVLFLYT